MGHDSTELVEVKRQREASLDHSGSLTTEGVLQDCPLASRLVRSSRSQRRAFTLVELLVVIGIILVLMALLLPALNVAWKSATRTRMALDIQTISTALENYRGDFQQYPQVYTAGRGSWWLCNALVGPANLSTSGVYGFRNVTGGKIWGPYIPPDKIKMGDPSGAGNVSNYVLMDKYNHPILYYPAKGVKVDITQPGGYLGTNGMFNPNDNTSTGSYDSTTTEMTALMFQLLMGDANGNGAIDPGETPAYTGNYVLWSAGPDERFGPLVNPTGPVSPSNPCDDVHNFP